MSTFIKIQSKGQITIPTNLRSQIGLSEGDYVEVKVERKKIIITPQVIIDRSKFPNADDEYTAAQRRVIDARLAVAEKGPHYGPFETADKAIAFLNKEIKKRKSKKT